MVQRFPKKEFWKFIGSILLEVRYNKKGRRLWVKTHESDNEKV